MEHDILEFVKRSLNEAPVGTAVKIAKEKEIAYDTVLRIKRGATPNPGIKTLELIASYFRERAA